MFVVETSDSPKCDQAGWRTCKAPNLNLAGVLFESMPTKITELLRVFPQSLQKMPGTSISPQGFTSKSYLILYSPIIYHSTVKTVGREPSLRVDLSPEAKE
jgi:hypothetical protein